MTNNEKGMTNNEKVAYDKIVEGKIVERKNVIN